jgi:hypothetical protein
MNGEVLIRNLVLDDALAVGQLGIQAFNWPSERII